MEPITLRQLRKNLGVTQATLGARMNISYQRVASIENMPLRNLRLSTIRRYIEALGGTLRITAEFDEREYALL